MQLDITLGNAIEIVSILGVGLGLFWRAAGLTFEVRELRRDLETLKPHGVSVPLLQAQVNRQDAELEGHRQRLHKLANDLTYALARIDEAFGPREPSRPDLTVEDPHRRR